MKMHSDLYEKHLKEFADAQSNFNKKPCKETATILSNLREKKYSDSEIFTAEYLIEKKRIAKESDQKFASRMRNFMQTISIETMKEKKQISDSMYIQMHQENDIKNPITL